MVAEDILSIGEKITISLTILITGFVVVFAVLILLIGLIKIYGIIVTKALQSIEKKKATLEKTSENIVAVDESTEVPTTIDNDSLNEEIIAVIAAAVDAMYGENTVKIRSIKRVPQSRPVWGTAGIMDNTRPF